MNVLDRTKTMALMTYASDTSAERLYILRNRPQHKMNFPSEFQCRMCCGGKVSLSNLK